MGKIFLICMILLLSVGNVKATLDETWETGVAAWDIVGSWSTYESGGYDDGAWVKANPPQSNRYMLTHALDGDESYYSVWMNTTTGGISSVSSTYFIFQANDSTSYAAGDAYQCTNAVGVTNARALCLDYYNNMVSGFGFTYTPVYLTSREMLHYTISLIGSNAVINIYYANGTKATPTQTTPFTDLPEFNKVVVASVSGTSSLVTSNIDDLFVGVSDPDITGTGTITFDESTYDLGDVAYISGSLTNPDYATYNYRTVIIDPLDNIINAHTWVSNSLTETNFPLNINMQGTYTVKLQRYTSAVSYDYLATDTAYAGYVNNQSLSIAFNEYYYNTGDTVIINSNISNIDNSNYFYEVMILKPNGNFYNVHNITANESYSFVTNVPGEWNTILTAYPKSEPSMIENQATDSMFTYGAVQGVSWVSFNDTYYNKNSWARINYGISVNDFYDSHKMQITNQEGIVVFDRQIIAQSGYFDYYFYESGKYTVTIDRNWFALDWDLTDNEILATDVTEVTNTIEGGFTLGITPTTLNCGQTVYLSAETPNFWNTTNFTIKAINGTLITTILGQSGKWKTNQTGQFWVYLNDAGAVQDSGYFYVYGTCTGYDQISQDGQGGIQPKQYPKTDQATSNEGLQNNLLYFLGLPIFWGLIIYVGVIYTLAINGAGSTVPFVTPVIIFMELAIGMLDPYSAFVVVGVIIVYVLGFIAKIFSISVGDTVSSVTHIGKK